MRVFLKLASVKATAIGAVIMIQPLAAATQPTWTGRWELVEDRDDNSPLCLLVGAGKSPTTFLLVSSASGHRDKLITLGFSNDAWSIRKEQDIGEITLYSRTERLVARPLAANGGFLINVEAASLESFLKSSVAEGFWMERGGEIIGHYIIGNLLSFLDDLQRCGAKLHYEDPFSK